MNTKAYIENLLDVLGLARKPSLPLSDTPETIFADVERLVQARSEIRLCILYGSAAAGRLHSGSDIDIGVAAREALGPEEYLSLYRALSTGLNREIDLLDLRTAHGLVLSEALTKGTIIVCRDRNLRARLMQEVVYFNEDFRRPLDRMLRRRIERFING